MAGRGRVPAVSIELTEREREELEGLSRRRRTAQGLARRAQIVLAAAEGLVEGSLNDRTIGDRIGIGLSDLHHRRAAGVGPADQRLRDRGTRVTRREVRKQRAFSAASVLLKPNCNAI